MLYGACRYASNIVYSRDLPFEIKFGNRKTPYIAIIIILFSGVFNISLKILAKN